MKKCEGDVGRPGSCAAASQGSYAPGSLAGRNEKEIPRLDCRRGQRLMKKASVGIGHFFTGVAPVGFEPTTLGSKVRCSTG